MQRDSRLGLRHVRRLVAGALAAAGLVVSGSASALIVQGGVDIFHTGSGTTLETIPAGFFCAGSQAVSDHPLKGAEIVTSPSNVLGGTDTVIERLDDTGPGGTTGVRIVALHMVGSQPVSRCGAQWDVDVFLRPVSQPVGAMTIFQKAGGGGTYTASFQVLARAEFRRQTDGLLRTLNTSVDIETDGPQDWAPEPGLGGVEIDSSFWIDTNNDGAVDTVVPGTSNFAAGWSWNSSTSTSSLSNSKHKNNGHPIIPPNIDICPEFLAECCEEPLGCCGLGFELPLLLLPLLALRVARRR